MTIHTIKASRFFRPIYRKAKKARHPQSVMFELTYRCNFYCSHCYVDGSPKTRKELTTEQVFAILDQLKEMGVLSVAFTGGEPMLRKDIFDILGYAKQCGFQTALLTNGSFINATAVRRLAAVNVNKVDVTVNSLIPKVFERLTGVKGSQRRVLRAIRLLVQAGVQTRIKSTAMVSNREELVRIGEWARELNIIYNVDTEIVPSRAGTTHVLDQESLRLDEADAIRRLVYPEMFRRKNRRIQPRAECGKSFNCAAGKTTFAITPRGKMIFCLAIAAPQYDILAAGVRSCWEKLKQDVDRINRTIDFVCQKCELADYCDWCPGRSYLEHKTLNHCSDYCKRNAIQAKQGGSDGCKSCI